MKTIQLPELTQFSRTAPLRKVLFDSPSLRILSLNFEPGQEMPVHGHHADAEVAFLVLEGEGVFIGEDMHFPVQAGTLQIMPVSDPHGFRARTRLRLLIIISPPF
jgi:quercetin dioxygenase-like cupin family protein